MAPHHQAVRHAVCAVVQWRRRTARAPPTACLPAVQHPCVPRHLLSSGSNRQAGAEAVVQLLAIEVAPDEYQAVEPLLTRRPAAGGICSSLGSSGTPHRFDTIASGSGAVAVRSAASTACCAGRWKTTGHPPARRQPHQGRPTPSALEEKETSMWTPWNTCLQHQGVVSNVGGPRAGSKGSRPWTPAGRQELTGTSSWLAMLTCRRSPAGT